MQVRPAMLIIRLEAYDKGTLDNCEAKLLDSLASIALAETKFNKQQMLRPEQLWTHTEHDES